MVESIGISMNRWRDRLRASPLAARLARGAFWSLSAAVAGRVVTLFATIAIARNIGKEGYGQLGIIQSSMALFAVFAGAGLGATASKYVAQYRDTDPEKAGRILTLSGLVALGTGTLGAIALLLAAPWLASYTLGAPELTNSLRVSAIALFFVALNGAQGGALAGLEAFGTYAVASTVGGILTTICTVIGGIVAGVIGCIWGTAIGQTITWVIFHVMLRRAAKHARISINAKGWLQEISVLHHFSLPILLCDVLIVPTTWICNTFLVKSHNGFAEMGLYNLGNQWRLAVLFLPSTLCASLMPITSNLHGLGRRQSYRKVLMLQMAIAGCLGMLAALVIAICSPLLVAAYGAEFHGAEPVIIMLAGSAVFFAIENVFGNDMTSRGKVWASTFICVLVSVAMILSSKWLVPWYGARGLALAMLLSYFLYAVLMGAYSFRTFWATTDEPLAETPCELPTGEGT